MPRNIRGLNAQNLYKREEFVDREAGGLIVMVPVGDDGMPDEKRQQLCFGWTQIQVIGRFEFAIPTSDPSLACGPLWTESLEKALDAFESDMRKRAIAQASQVPLNQQPKVLL